MGEVQISARESRRAHFRFTSTFTTVTMMTPAARSRSLRNNAAVTARLMLGRVSTDSCLRDPHALRKRVVLCSRRSSLAISIDSASHGAGVASFTGFTSADVDGAAVTQPFEDDLQGGMRGNSEGLDPVEHHADRAHVFLHRAEDRGRFPQDVGALQGGEREERRNGGGENERGAVDPLDPRPHASQRRSRPMS